MPGSHRNTTDAVRRLAYSGPTLLTPPPQHTHTPPQLCTFCSGKKQKTSTWWFTHHWENGHLSKNLVPYSLVPSSLRNYIHPHGVAHIGYPTLCFFWFISTSIPWIPTRARHFPRLWWLTEEAYFALQVLPSSETSKTEINVVLINWVVLLVQSQNDIILKKTMVNTCELSESNLNPLFAFLREKQREFPL